MTDFEEKAYRKGYKAGYKAAERVIHCRKCGNVVDLNNGRLFCMRWGDLTEGNAYCSYAATGN